MSLKVNNPEALSWKYPNRGGISTRAGVITELPDDIVLSQAEVDAIEVEHAAHVTAIAYKEKRRVEYPPLGDQLDAIWMELNSRRMKGENLIQDADDMLGVILNIKKKHPKPE